MNFDQSMLNSSKDLDHPYFKSVYYSPVKKPKLYHTPSKTNSSDVFGSPKLRQKSPSNFSNQQG